MRQTPLLRWIDAAEARLICTLAQENPARAIVAPAPRRAQPFNALLSCGSSCAWGGRAAMMVPDGVTGLHNALSFSTRAAYGASA
jgi:hypothetical protein